MLEAISSALEHVSFPILIVTGLLLFVVGGWKIEFDWSWRS